MTSEWAGNLILPDGCEPVIYGHEPGCACGKCTAHRVRMTRGTHEIPAAHTSLHAGPEDCTRTVASEADRIRAVIAEPLGLADWQLPAWGLPLDADGCSSCLRPVAVRSGRCLYCDLGQQVLARQVRVRQAAMSACRVLALMACATGLSLVLLIACGGT